jgi:CO dehydrogenase/acetyl-CoA synthase delta subunit
MTLAEAGADILVLRHPGSVAVLREALDELAKGA